MFQRAERMGQEWGRGPVGGCVAGPGEGNGSLDLLVHLWKNPKDIHKGKGWDLGMARYGGL